ncbi:MBL fold metallo-hydrolase [Oceanobacillus jeddahense]|uniref:MBL fold metallo-hydrolase n=1 Tax=Oceanobacillus jeddahense TaxID=1462527 RepID=UPI0036285E94
MKVHFLGTAAAEGFPNVFCRCQPCQDARKAKGRNIRTRSSVVIDDQWRVDYPPDAYYQALRDEVDMSKVNHLLLTHTHYDHLCAGDLLSRIEGFAHGVEQPLNIYGNDLALQQCRTSFSEESGIQQQFNMRRLIPFEAFWIGQAKITPLLADHDPRETCLLFFIEKDGKHLLYGNDSGWFPSATWDWLEGRRVDMAILDCTVGMNGNPRSRNHMSVETVIEVKKRFQAWHEENTKTKIIATHFSHNCGLLYQDLVDILAPYQIEVAYDGLVKHI